jgi:hypothetical protein
LEHGNEPFETMAFTNRNTMSASMQTPVVVALVSLAIFACGGSPTPSDGGDHDSAAESADASEPADAFATACPGGARPERASCPGGVFWTECGGDGPSVFACNEASGGCTWFVGGCVAGGYRPSGCAASDICCETSEAGTWPFQDDWQPSMAMALSDTVEDIRAAGHMEIDRDAPSTIDVTIDPTWVPTAGSIECTGDVAYDICDGTTAQIGGGDSFVLIIPVIGRPTSTGLTLEVVRSSIGDLIARAFPRQVTDAAPVGGASCESSGVPEGLPTVVGTIVLGSFEPSRASEMHGEARLVVGDGTAVVRF